MADQPEEHHEDPGLGYLDDLGALFRPLSDAEIAKRKRLSEQPAGELTPEMVHFGLWELDSPGLTGWDDQGTA